jgi:hypothetical protein
VNCSPEVRTVGWKLMQNLAFTPGPLETTPFGRWAEHSYAPRRATADQKLQSSVSPSFD